MASRPSKLRRQEERWAYLFLLPQYLGLLCFVLGPVVVTLFLSFSEWNLVAPPRWIGLQNYQVSFQTDVFWQTWRNTIYYVVVSVAGGIVFSLALALALNEKLRGVTLYRGIYFLPVVTSAVAVSMVWRWLYNPEFGLFNAVLTTIGLPTLPWLNSLKWAMPSVIIMSIWQTVGYNMVIFLAGLQGIADQFYEAAEMDGATAWQKFRHITLPLLSPTTFFILITATIGAFQAFNQIYIMTNGGPANATRVILLHIYILAFRLFKIGEASAVSWVLFLILFILTLINFFVARKWVHYG
ncbi:MAG: sugar ABC transporter permease [Chloroflexi bacterium]|nr:sugar ABC transporter permease [Chloroflexota bacterium]